MQKKINLHGEDLYSIQEILDTRNISRTFFERKDILSNVVSFGGQKYINKENFIRYDYLASLEESCYRLSQALKVLNIDNRAESVNNIITILNTIIEHIEFERHIFYTINDVIELSNRLADSDYPISLLLSEYVGEPVIYDLDFCQFVNSNKLKIFGRRKPGKYVLMHLFSHDTKLNVVENLCLKCDIENLYELYRKCLKVNLEDIFINYIQIKGNAPNTYLLMKNFYLKYINNSKSPNLKTIAIELVRKLDILYSKLKREIYFYSESEIKKEILQHSWANDRRVIKFLQYVKANNDYGFSKDISFEYKSNYKKTEDDLYLIDEWRDTFDYLTDIPLHLKNAYANRIYAQYWCGMLIHLFSTFRVSDITNTSALGLESHEFSSDKYLISKPLTFTEAQAIVNLFKSVIEHVDTVKTDTEKHFYCHLSGIEAMATSLVVLDCHRIMADEDELFTISNFDSKRIAERFPGLPIKFVSTTANKSLLTYVHDITAYSENAAKAYTLSSTMRSHSTGYNSIYSETTAVYIQKSELEGSAENIAYHVCERGVFGWLYLAMLEFVKGKIKSLTDATTQIDELKKQISVDGLEDIAEFLLQENKKQKSVLKALSEYTREDIAEFLMSIGTASAASKEATIPCILGKQCSKRNANECYLCACSIPTTYTLMMLNNKLLFFFDKLDQTVVSETALRQKYTYFIQKILFVFMDAKKHFKQYDAEYLTAFIDFDMIQTKLESIPDYKYLRLEETNGR